MNYKELLRKYIRYIYECEGTDFLDVLEKSDFINITFTEDEWDELLKLAE